MNDKLVLKNNLKDVRAEKKAISISVGGNGGCISEFD